MDPHNPIMSGVVQNQDSYMKGKIAQRAYYDKVEESVVEAMDEFYRLTGRRYDLVESYCLEDAEYVIVGMGSMIETCEATVDYVRKTKGLKVGAVHVTCYRPFPGPELVEALKHVKALAVIERLDNPMGQSNPLTVEVKAAFADALTGAAGYPEIDRVPTIYSGSAGLGSRDVRAGDFVAAFQHMARGEKRRYFVLGIRHPLALTEEVDPDVRPVGAFSMRGHSVGGYGSVTTNKIIATISGDLFGMDAQAYPKYGSEKKGLPTTYYLTLADDRIRMHSELSVVDFIPLNNESAFLTGGNPLVGLCDGGTIFIQSTGTTPEEVWARVPAYVKRFIRDKNARVLALDAARIAREVASDPDLEVRMQGIVLLGIFLKATPYVQRKGLSRDDVMKGAEKSLRKYFGKRGEQVIQENLTCVRRGFDEVFEIPPEVIAQDLEVELPENLFPRL
jgi:pyruvate-ferredoxin/flavodoxin oxidoreductase